MANGDKDARQTRKQTSEEASEFQPGTRRMSRIWAFIFLVALFVVFMLVMWKALTVLLLMFAGALIAIGLRFLSDYLTQFTGIPPAWSLTIVLVLIGALAIAGGVLAAPSVMQQFQELAAGLQTSVKQLEQSLRQNEAGKWLLDQVSGLQQGIEDAQDLWARVASLFTTTFGAVAGFLLTLVVGVFLAYSPRLYINGFLRLVPLDKRGRACEIISELGHTLRWWMVGQLISMLILLVTTWVMLWVLGVPLAFILALITGLLTFIPYLGPIIALVPILLIALVESPTLALWVFGLYMVIQNVEANVIMPIVFKKTVHLPPVLTIVAQILLGAIFGFIGIILATPLMAVGIVLVRMIYVEDVIGDDMSEPVKEQPV
jgi:predicted PurR-regulated permease PerM